MLIPFSPLHIDASLGDHCSAIQSSLLPHASAAVLASKAPACSRINRHGRTDLSSFSNPAAGAPVVDLGRHNSELCPPSAHECAAVPRHFDAGSKLGGIDCVVPMSPGHPVGTLGLGLVPPGAEIRSRCQRRGASLSREILEMSGLQRMRDTNCWQAQRL